MTITRSLALAGALIAAALIGGTLVGTATASEETETDGDSAGLEAYCDVFMDTLASDLGVTRESLVAAGRSAANSALDAAAEAGDLPDEAADRLRERIAGADGTGCGWFGSGFRFGFGAGLERGIARGVAGTSVLAAAADALGMQTIELFEAIRDSGSLEAVAEAQGTAYDDVKAAVSASVQAELDAAVENGRSQERADAALERVTDWLEAGGELPAGGARHFGPGHGRGPLHGWGSHDDADPDPDHGEDAGA